MIALMNPEDSWVARWQKISKYLFSNYYIEHEIFIMLLILQIDLQKEFMLYLLLVDYLNIL